MEVIRTEYTIQQLAKLSGVTTRTLRYYDEIALLKPLRLTNSGYRMYGEWEVELLQQILLYRELGLKLEEIKLILDDSNFDIQSALLEHQKKLFKERERIEKMIRNVKKTLQSLKGEYQMNDQERFEGFKDKMIKENENKYGIEIRDKYGDSVVDASNTNLRGMSEIQFKENQVLEKRIIELLKEAMAIGDIHDKKAQHAVECHKEWLKQYWSSYSKEAHKGLADMYVADARFTTYYDQHQKGMAQFLRDAIYANL